MRNSSTLCGAYVSSQGWAPSQFYFPIINLVILIMDAYGRQKLGKIYEVILVKGDTAFIKIGLKSFNLKKVIF